MMIPPTAIVCSIPLRPNRVKLTAAEQLIEIAAKIAIII